MGRQVPSQIRPPGAGGATASNWPEVQLGAQTQTWALRLLLIPLLPTDDVEEDPFFLSVDWRSATGSSGPTWSKQQPGAGGAPIPNLARGGAVPQLQFLLEVKQRSTSHI